MVQKFLRVQNNPNQKTKFYLWFKINISPETVFICSLYIPPYNSPYFEDSISEEINNDILDISNKCDRKILLIGEFNGRIGQISDTAIEDGDTYTNTTHLTSKIDKIKKSFYSKVNAHGKKLIQLCTSKSLCILNGRKEGDSFGKFTFISKSNGASTVNFAITSEKLYEDVSNFVVNPQTYLSDHSQIRLWISEDKMKISNKSDLTYENDTYKLPDSFLFEKKSNIDFKNVFG